MTRSDPNRPEAYDGLSNLDPHTEQPHRPADDREVVYFEGSPLVRGELGSMAIWWLLGLVLLVAPFAWWFFQNEWWPWFIVAACVVVGLLLFVIPFVLVRRISYRISNYRIDYERGLMSKRIDTLELWHVDDISFHQSFFGRLFGVGTLTVMSNDKTTPRLDLWGLPKPRPIFDSLKQRIIAVKRQRGVIKMDMG